MSVADVQKKTLIVIILTLVTMIAEIAFGLMTHSMALTADGWHMGTHAFALFITFFACILSIKLAQSDTIKLSVNKISTLAGFTSSILLGLTGIWILGESVMRFIHPLEIQFGEAIIVAVIGLVVNLISILIMGAKEHTHANGCSHEHKEEKDYNFIAAYMHILADALTSFFAIFALLAGKYFGLVFLDPFVGILGGLLIISWAWGLIKSTSLVLLDVEVK